MDKKYDIKKYINSMMDKLECLSGIKRDFLILSNNHIYSHKAELDNFSKQEVMIVGTQIFMKENLSVEYFRNGDKIPFVSSDEEWLRASTNREPAWCYPLVINSESDLRFGKLYNWYAVNDERGLAPEGWHVPSRDEWNILKEMKNAVYEDVMRYIRESLERKSMDGFNSLRMYDGEILKNTSGIDYWSSTASKQNTELAYCHEIYYLGFTTIYEDDTGKGRGLYVRCVKN